MHRVPLDKYRYIVSGQHKKTITSLDNQKEERRTQQSITNEEEDPDSSLAHQSKFSPLSSRTPLYLARAIQDEAG
jgi:hypothetical protein